MNIPIRLMSKMMAVILVSISALLLYTCVYAGKIQAVQPVQTNITYDEWINRMSKIGWHQNHNTDNPQLRLVIASVEKEEKAEDLISGGAYLEQCTRLDVDGRVVGYHISANGSGGGGHEQISNDDLKRVNLLISLLPDDKHQLPPATRRILVQVFENGSSRIHVYDRANAPESVHEIIRLLHARIPSWVLNFSPVSEWVATSSHGGRGGDLCLSPDGRLIISSSMNGYLKLWSADTHKLIREIPMLNARYGLTLSPDKSVLLIENWGSVIAVNPKTWRIMAQLSEPTMGRRTYRLSYPKFTADGRFLLFQTDEPALKIFDMKSWKRQESLPELPKAALAYSPSPKGNRALYLSNDGTLYMWDPKQHKDIAKLDANVAIRQVVYSPDQSMVATVTVHGQYWSVYRIRIWNTLNGMLLRELRPSEMCINEKVDALLWSPDSRYVLAATRDGSGGRESILVWSAISGRQRGAFTVSNADITAFTFFDNNRKLAADCTDGKIRIWDAAGAFEKIRNFTASEPIPGLVMDSDSESVLSTIAPDEFALYQKLSSKTYDIDTARSALSLVNKTYQTWGNIRDSKVGQDLPINLRCVPMVAQQFAWECAIKCFKNTKDPAVKALIRNEWDALLGRGQEIRWMASALCNEWDKDLMTDSFFIIAFEKTTDSMVIHAFCQVFGKYGEQPEKDLLTRKLDSIKLVMKTDSIELKVNVANIQTAINKISSGDRIGPCSIPA